MNARQVYEDVKKGLGPMLAGLIEKDGWTDIILNADGSIYFESSGKMQKVYSYKDDAFKVKQLDFKAITNAAYTLAAYTNTYIREENPSFSAVIPYMNVRVHFKIPPVVDQITAAFRKPSSVVFTLEDMMSAGCLDEAQADYISTAILGHKNIILAGSTGSGKTTFTNSLISLIPRDERLFIIEDINELKTQNENVEHVLITPNYSYVRAVEDALRSRPDRIIMGECLKGDQTLSLLSAWNTGHAGGFTTIHATDAHHVIRRLNQLCSQVTASSQIEMIKDAVDVVVFLRKDPETGQRKVHELYDVKSDKYID